MENKNTLYNSMPAKNTIRKSADERPETSQPLEIESKKRGSLSVPFNKPYLTGREFEYMSRAVQNRAISGDGYFTKQCSRWLEQYLGAPRVLLTTSCTHALDMAALLLDIQEGDEIIVPSFTFVSTVNAFVLRKAKPVFIDIRPDTLNLNEGLLSSLITPKTKAVITVHYAGVACEMDTILSIAGKHGIPVIEDNAHGLFGRYKNKPLGTFGAMATLSFHETKNLTCGEGGALILNESSYIRRAEMIREKGTDRSEFFRGHVNKYTWKDIGSSYLPSDLLAAFLWAQIESADLIQRQRTRLWNSYQKNLKDWAQQNEVQLPQTPSDCCHPSHLFYLLMPSSEKRDLLLNQLQSLGIGAVFHYLPLHQSDMGKRIAPRAYCPVTDHISGRLLRLPMFVELSVSQQNRVIQAVRQFRV
jgi:dTDP-4-amino-4,6-dideoxygalactose transaminase